MPISIAKAVAVAANSLRKSGVGEPRLEAGLLLAHSLRCDRTFLVAHNDDEIPSDRFEEFQDFVVRRAAGEPLQYITGHQEFFKLDFEVTPAVLIPRPESELIVEAALELFAGDASLTVADVGAGSGCLAISILHERSKANAVAIDASTDALTVAETNARRHQVDDRLRLVESDLFAGLRGDEVFDAIVSNPPYVSDQEMKDLQREVGREPRLALAGGVDGLDVIRRLLEHAPRRLKAGGYLIFEFGINQDTRIIELVDERAWELIDIRKDLQRIPRTMILRKK
ncbi:MAG TPA: peptide chain release factor N(5)-glutamine methyltransferase [Pyrinomonadaceae bacterium]|nr:peptide chain release factor N(5)-glutamine methyltransferase [Pyrinomonadaceae bacterium]